MTDELKKQILRIRLDMMIQEMFPKKMKDFLMTSTAYNSYYWIWN